MLEEEEYLRQAMFTSIHPLKIVAMGTQEGRLIIKWPSDCCCSRSQGFETRVMDAVKPSVLVSKSGTSQSNRDMYPNLTPILERKGDKQRSKVLTPRVGREGGEGVVIV